MKSTKKHSGFSLVEVAIGIALLGVFSVGVMGLVSTMSKQTGEMNRSVDRLSYEQQIGTTLADNGICSCNFASVPIPATGVTSLTGLKKNCASAVNDLFTGTDHQAGTNLKVTSITVGDAVLKSGITYTADIKINYSSNDSTSVALKPGSFTLLFDKTSAAGPPFAVQSCGVIVGAGAGAMAGSYWQKTSSTDIHYDGNIGVGTSAPTSPLTIESATPSATYNDALLINNPVNNGPGTASSIVMNAISTKGVRLAASIQDATVGAEKTDFKIQNYSFGTWIDRLVVDSGGNIGIGSTGPFNGKLQVNGKTSSSSFRALQGTPLGDDAQMGYAFGEDGDTGLFSSGLPVADNGQVSLYANAIQVLTANNMGRVGIGTSTPQAELEVVDPSADNDVRINLRAVVGGNQLMQVGRSTTQGFIDTKGAPFNFFTDNTPSPTVSIAPNGYIGIGTTTPRAPLDIVMDASINSGGLRLGKSFSAGSNEGGEIQLDDAWGIGTWSIDNYGADGNEQFRIFRDKGEQNVDALAISAATGQTKLKTYTGSMQLALESPSGRGYVGSYNGGNNLMMSAGTFWDGSVWKAEDSGVSAIYLGPTQLSFHTDSGLTPGSDIGPSVRQRMVISNTGNVLIGDMGYPGGSGFAERLHVTGGITTGGDIPTYGPNSGNGILTIRPSNTASWFTFTNNGDNILRINGGSSPFKMDNSGHVGIRLAGNPTEALEVNGNVKATSFLTTSDETLKNDIKKIENAGESIAKLLGVRFNWKQDNKPEIGFIAQDVEEVEPSLVSTDPASGLKSVKYANITALLVEALKENQLQIKELQDQVRELKQELQQSRKK